MTFAGSLLKQYSLLQHLEFFARIMAACVCGAIIGFERSKRFKEAGIRTHIIVCCAAAMVMIISKYGFADLIGPNGEHLVGTNGTDPARLAAQIITGVSFLGAGIIFRNGNTIKGLTTAAGIWATAGIGLAIGSGMYILGILTTAVGAVIQIIMHRHTIGGDSTTLSRMRCTTSEPKVFRKQLDEYLECKKSFEIHRDNQQQNAQTFQIGTPSIKINPEKNNLTGWLETPDKSESEEKACAQVRDTNETIEVIAVRRCGSGYGFFAPENPSARDISDKISDPDIAQQLAGQTLRLPPSVIRGKKVDRVIEWLEDYNRRYLRNWQNQTWLKGTLGVIFDESGIFRIDDLNICLQYDCQYGLRTKEEDAE